MRPSLPSSFAKVCLIFCFAILAVSTAFAQTPDHIGFKLQGCRFYAGITLPDGSGNVICSPDDPTKRPDCYHRVTVYGEPPGALRGVEPLPVGIENIRKAE